MRAGDIAAMRALDCAATGVDRTDMLCHLAGESAVTVLVDDGTGGLGGLGGLGGFGMLQEGRVGRIVGPVVAADADGATRILHGLIRHAASVGPPHALVIDCLRPSPLAAALRSLGFSPARELWRMCCPPWRYVVNLSVSSPRIPQGKTPGHGSNSFGLVLHTETASTSPPWRHVSGVPNAAPSPTRCNRVATLESRATSCRMPPVRKPFCRAIVEKPAAFRYQWAVSQPVKLSEELVLDARLTSAVAERSIAGQIEYWAQLGRAIEPLLQGAQALALRRDGAARPLSECLGGGQSAQAPQNRHSRFGCQAFRELL